MEITLKLKEGRVLEDAKRYLFLAAIDYAEGDPWVACTFLGITHMAFMGNCAKYDFTSLLRPRKSGPPINYEKHAFVLKQRAAGYSLERIGKELGVSGAKVSQIINSLVKKKKQAEKAK